eukprot:3325265-Pyramimonas_sp.AAC.1
MQITLSCLALLSSTNSYIASAPDYASKVCARARHKRSLAIYAHPIAQLHTRRSRSLRVTLVTTRRRGLAEYDTRFRRPPSPAWP